jgi:hypothetical protein
VQPNPFGAARPREQVIAEREGKKETEVLKEQAHKEWKPNVRHTIFFEPIFSHFHFWIRVKKYNELMTAVMIQNVLIWQLCITCKGFE